MSDRTRELRTHITPTPPARRIADFYDPSPPTPGNVGVALCGGGSRAFTAAMGQLRGLDHLTDSQGASLLSRTRALSTVSGGSWAAVPWIYRPGPAKGEGGASRQLRRLFGVGRRVVDWIAGRPHGRPTSDEEFLGGFVADPGRLVPIRSPGHRPAETLDELCQGNIGACCVSGFSIADLAVEVLYLRLVHDTPRNMLWQVLMARHFLAPYDLYRGDHQRVPSSLFSADRATLERDVTAPNPSLRRVTAYLARPPFHICNTAMFIDVEGQRKALLAPVQVTPFFTGIVGRPDGVDENGRRPGGGGVTSFSFGSELGALDGSDARVRQQRTWSLTDAIGTSSAALADPLKNKVEDWLIDPKQRDRQLRERSDATRKRVGRPSWRQRRRLKLLRLLAPELELETELRGILDALIPAYPYWPVLDAAPQSNIRPTHFADGGAIDNTGVTALLSYADVDAVISFLNSNTRLAPADHGVQDAGDAVERRTRIEVDGMVPPLFGYQPYDPDHGYRLFAGDPYPKYPHNAHNQVFPATAFPEFLEGLWSASGSGSYRHPARFEQTLSVLPNPWLGVEGGRTVRVLWMYLTRVRDWYDALSPEVQALIGPFDDKDSFAGFPNYSTADIELTPTQVNLMAHLTAWCVAGDEAQESVRSLYGHP